MAATTQRLGRYELLAHLASGGMGEIHLARLSGRAGFEKLVVVKRLLPELLPSREHLAMFLDEARLSARLSHPNVCEVHDLDDEGGQVFIVMPYLEGVPLAALMRRPDDEPAATHLRFVLGVLVQVCAGLHHAHELRDARGEPLGVVHRDVSPSNVMVTTAGVAKVLDFGIAKARMATSVTERGVLKGKLAYMSPEAMAESAVDRRADVFCVGILAWEAITGTPLFQREGAVETANAVLGAPVPDLGERAPAEVARVIARTLSRDPGRRPATAEALGEALVGAMAGHGGVMDVPQIAATLERRAGGELRAQRARIAAVTAAAATGAAAGAAGAASAAGDVVAAGGAARPGVAGMPTVAARPGAMTRAAKPPARAPWLAGGLVVLLGAGVAVALVAREGGGAAGAAAATDADAGAAAAVAADAAPAADAGTATAADAGAAADAAPAPPPSPGPARPVRPGFLSIDSRPFAVIFVDGKRLGETPLIREPVPPGRHKLRARLADGRERELTVVIEPGRLAAPVTLTW